MAAVDRVVVIKNRQGLHARPIAMIAQAAAKFSSVLRIEVDGREVDGRSILQLMTLCASQGKSMMLRAVGEDASQMIDMVAGIVESGFGED